jgi:hypothetical protein
MAKTFAPALIRSLRKIRIYINRHRPALNAVLTASQQSALDSIVTAVAAFDGITVQEAP